MALVEKFETLGIGTGKVPSKEIQDPQARAALENAIKEGEKAINAKIETLGAEGQHSWAYNLKYGNYGNDYLLRAAIGKQGLGANVPEESLYPMAHNDSSGEKLSGANSYVIHFDKDQFPPVDAFWSITIYDSVTRLLVPNEINRYAISDRSKAEYNEDGSLDIFIQRDKPDKETNWLPAPEGNFYLVLRLYNPQKTILDNKYEYPKIEKVA